MKPELLALLEDLATWREPVRALFGRRRLPRASHDDLKRRSDSLVAALHPRSMRLRLVENHVETPSTRTLRFVRLDGELPPFRPGQYVSLRVRIGETSTTRPYSVSSAPGASTLDLTVKAEPDGFVSPWLCARDPGWEVDSSGPAGSFVHDPLRDRNRLVLLAGGSGITPFMSMLRHWADVGFPAPTVVLHNSRSPDDVIFGEAIAGLAERCEDLTAVSVISRPPPGWEGPSGHLDAALIGEHAPHLRGTAFFVCGPDGFLRHAVGELTTLGVPRHAIRREAFGPPADVTQVEGWPTGVAADATFTVKLPDGSIPARASEPLLVALELAGRRVPAVCRTGECADCRMRVVAGEAWSLPDSGVREADRTRGFVHTCVAYPVSDLTLDPG
jgi:ferredoxin-NADP reductase